MAKKKSTSAQKSVPNKAMYPRGLVVPYDPDHPDLFIAGMKANEAIIGKPSDIEGLLEWYIPLLRATMSPYFDGAHPLHELPASAPQQDCDALAALHSATLIQDALRGELAGASLIVRLAIGWGIDLGTSLQRYGAQCIYGKDVALGRTLVAAKAAGNMTTSQRAATCSELSRIEYDRRLSQLGNPARMKTATLKNMATVLGKNGKPFYGTFATLVR